MQDKEWRQALFNAPIANKKCIQKKVQNLKKKLKLVVIKSTWVQTIKDKLKVNLRNSISQNKTQSLTKLNLQPNRFRLILIINSNLKVLVNNLV